MPNLPNSLTIFRILLVPVLMNFLLAAVPSGDVLAVMTFVVAAATDSLDGHFARRRKQVTVLGTILDPLADKLLVSSALIALVELGKLSAWVAMLIIAREFAVSGLRMVAAAQHAVIKASRWGKVKTASQMVAIVAVIMEPAGNVWAHRVSWILLAIALLLTVWSGIDYFMKARPQLSTPSSTGEEMGGEGVVPRAEQPAGSEQQR